MEWQDEDLITSGREFYKLEVLRRKIIGQRFFKVEFEYFGCDVKYI